MFRVPPKAPDFHPLICASSAKALCAEYRNDSWQHTFSFLCLTNINLGMEILVCKNREAAIIKLDQSHELLNQTVPISSATAVNIAGSNSERGDMTFLLCIYIYMSLRCGRLREEISPPGD